MPRRKALFRLSRNTVPRISNIITSKVFSFTLIFLTSIGLLTSCGSLEQNGVLNPYNDADTTAGKKNGDSDIKLVVGPKYQSYDQFESAVWIAHALARLECEKSYPQLSFENEYCAVNTAVDIWRDIKKKNEVSNASLDDMAAVKKAGFLREYVWEYWRQEYWFQPSDLILEKFDLWRNTHLAQHHANISPDIIAIHTDADIEPRFVTSSFNNGYPENIADFSYTGDGTYYPAQLGKSVRYQIDKHSTQRGYADIYIYDIPKDQQSSERRSLTLAVSSQVKAELLDLREKGMFNDFSEVLEDTMTHAPSQTYFARGVYRFTMNHVKYFSTLYLCLNKNKIFKIRLTYPDNSHYQNSDHFKGFAFEAFEKLFEQNKKST